METANPSITITLDVLRLLFQNTRRWWYHRRLRERGEVAEADLRSWCTSCLHPATGVRMRGVIDESTPVGREEENDIALAQQIRGDLERDDHLPLFERE